MATRPENYVYEDDKRYTPQIYQDEGGERVVEQNAPHEQVWKIWANARGVDTKPVAEWGGEGDNLNVTYSENPEYTAFKQQAKDAGYSVGMSDIPGYRYDKNFTIFDPKGQALGDPIRLQTGQGFLSGLSSVAKETAPVWMTALTMGGGSGAIGGLVAPGAPAAVQTAIGNAVISGGTTALGGGDIEDVLKNAALAGGASYVGSTIAPDISESLGGGSLGSAGSAAVKTGIQQLLSGKGLDPEKLALSAALGGVKGVTTPLPGIGDTGQEGFFDIGGEGYVPYEEQYGFIADPMPGEAYFDQVIRDIEPGIPYTEAPYDDILADIGQLPTGGFIGENVQSGIPEWDEAAQRAGLELEAPPPYNPYEEAFQKIGSSPDGNLEQDFVVDQNGNIIDTAGNRGEFIDGDWVVRTDPRDFSGYVAPPAAPAPAPAPAAPAPAPAAAPKPAAGSGLNLNALIAALAAAGYKEEEPEPYQLAQINVQSPFGTGPYASTGKYT